MRSGAALGLSVVAMLAVAPAASAYNFDPPPWWNDGKALVEARGGSCESSSHQAGEGVFIQTDPNGPSEPRGVYTEQTVECKHVVPSAVTKPFAPREGCNGGAQSGGNDSLPPL